ncbi:MAG: hypothetical protein R3D56_00615 [Paracoccaceae bacterium]
MIAQGLQPALAAADLAEVLAPPAWQIGLAIGETLDRAVGRTEGCRAGDLRGRAEPARRRPAG